MFGNTHSRYWRRLLEQLQKSRGTNAVAMSHQREGSGVEPTPLFAIAHYVSRGALRPLKPLASTNISTDSARDAGGLT